MSYWFKLYHILHLLILHFTTPGKFSLVKQVLFKRFLKQLVAVAWQKIGFYFQKSRNYFLIIEQIILDDSKLPIETIGNLLNVKKKLKNETHGNLLNVKKETHTHLQS